jgi:hypothetical protein
MLPYTWCKTDEFKTSIEQRTPWLLETGISLTLKATEDTLERIIH